MNAKTFATATFRDSYMGDVVAELQAFKTTVRGQRMTAYRWVCPKVCAYPGYNPSTNPDRLVRAAMTDRRFANVERVAA